MAARRHSVIVKTMHNEVLEVVKMKYGQYGGHYELIQDLLDYAEEHLTYKDGKLVPIEE